MFIREIALILYTEITAAARVHRATINEGVFMSIPCRYTLKWAS